MAELVFVDQRGTGASNPLTCELDDEALFYLRSRGVPHRDATNLLTLAFLAEAVEEIEDETLSAQVVEKISAWLLRRSA